MFKRVFFMLLGIGLGLMLGGWAVRRLERTTESLRPEQLASAAGRRASGLGGRVREAVAAGRVAATAKEEELRASFARQAEGS